MTRFAGPRLEGYAILGGVGLVAALATRRPELAVMAAPFALVLSLGLRPGPEPELDISLTLGAERVVAGEGVEAELRIRSRSPVDRLEVLLTLPAGVEISEGTDAYSFRLREDEERTIELGLRAVRWGRYDVGDVTVRARSQLRILGWETIVDRRQRLKVYPRAEALQRILAQEKPAAA